MLDGLDDSLETPEGMLEEKSRYRHLCSTRTNLALMAGNPSESYHGAVDPEYNVDFYKCLTPSFLVVISL
jgi:hypothetical protein